MYISHILSIEINNLGFHLVWNTLLKTNSNKYLYFFAAHSYFWSSFPNVEKPISIYMRTAKYLEWLSSILAEQVYLDKNAELQFSSALSTINFKIAPEITLHRFACVIIINSQDEESRWYVLDANLIAFGVGFSPDINWLLLSISQYIFFLVMSDVTCIRQKWKIDKYDNVSVKKYCCLLVYTGSFNSFHPHLSSYFLQLISSSKFFKSCWAFPIMIMTCEKSTQERARSPTDKYPIHFTSCS